MLSHPEGELDKKPHLHAGGCMVHQTLPSRKASYEITLTELADGHSSTALPGRSQSCQVARCLVIKFMECMTATGW